MRSGLPKIVSIKYVVVQDITVGEENFVGEDIYPHPQSFPLLEKSHPLQKFYHSSNLYLSTNPKNNFIEKENL